MKRSKQGKVVATDGTSHFAWRATPHRNLVMVDFWGPRGFQVATHQRFDTEAEAQAWLSAFLESKRRLGYGDTSGHLDIETIVRKARTGPQPERPALVLEEGETRARLRMQLDLEAELYGLEILAALLSSPLAPHLTELEVLDTHSGEQSFDEYIATLCGYRQLRALRRLGFLHKSWRDPEDDYASSYTYVSNVPELLQAFPYLSELVLQSSFLQQHWPIDHPRLKALSIRCGHDPSDLLPRLARSRLPALERLELDFLHREGFTREDPAPAWKGPALAERPSLRHLTFTNSVAGDAALLDLEAGHAQLETLDLTDSGVTDEGARRLLAFADRLPALKRLVLRENPLSAEASGLLRARFGDRMEV